MPSVILTIPLTRTYGSAANSIIGQYIAALTVSPTQLGGFYAAPLRVPVDFDVSRPANLFLWLAPVANSLVDGQAVALQCHRTIINADGSVTDTTLDLTWAVPAGWTTVQRTRVLLDAGGGVSIPGGALKRTDFLGLRFSRNGPAAADTFAQSVAFPTALELEYPQRCQYGCL